MAKQPALYQTSYSAQGRLQNDLLPEEHIVLQRAHAAMRMRHPAGLAYTFSYLLTLAPMYSKAFKDYDEFMERLDELEAHYDYWMRHHSKRFPIHIMRALSVLYREYCAAYNASGAGIRMEKYVSRESRLNQAMMNV